MKRFFALMMVAATLAVLSASGSASAADCEDRISFRYCGEHLALGSLPLAFKVNAATRPANLSQNDVVTAVSGAVAQWNAAWPIPNRTSPSCPVLCYDGTTTKATAAPDGVNAIFWSDSLSFPGCATEAHEGIAMACLWYKGPTGPDRDVIVEVDIVLSKAKTWYQPFLENGAGELAGLYPDVGDNNLYNVIGNGKGKYDVQSTLTHELGHAIGLEDIGSESGAWPRSLVDDTPKYTQTMYRWYYRGTTNKRTLDAGDLAGLQRIALDALLDG